MCPYHLIIVQAYQAIKIDINPGTEFLATWFAYNIHAVYNLKADTDMVYYH
jgi:hypothetical protein